MDYNVHLSQESNRETDKADGFADDNSTATEASLGSLQALKEICSEFANFSGLRTNTEKTTLLQIGRVSNLSDEIKNLGFVITNEVKLLGMDIDRDLNSLMVHFDDVAGKISRIIEHWERFNLTLPGRISICKTFMLSQIGYLGCIITPSEQQFKRLQKLVDDFCLGPLSVAKKRLYLPPTEGGLGLINLRDFITALQCTWVKRVTQHWGDNWRYDLKAKCYGNPLIAGTDTFSPRENPILHNICKSFATFKYEFTDKDENFKKANIFRNPYFRRGRDDDRMLCERFFGANAGDLEKIAKLKFEDFFIRRTPKSLDETNREFDLNLSLVTYMRLHEALEFTAAKNRNDDIKPSQSLEFFFRNFDRGSKPFRRILLAKELKRWKVENLNTAKTFIEITGVTKPDTAIIKFCWGEWSNGYFNNRCREFLFKFRNNILGLNARVCKFVPGINAECSLCIVENEPRPIPSESFAHVFFDCPHTSRYRSMVEKKLFPELRNGTEMERKTFWFLAILPGMNKNNPFLSAVVSLTNFYIWECKLKKESTPVSVLFENLLEGIRKALKMSSFLRTEKDKSNFFVCRHISDPP